MKCPRCTHQNPPGVKFCSECGQRMGTLCPDCNTMNLTESKFCHQCGQFLPKTNGFFTNEKSSGPLEKFTN
ncbi:MAG: zinc-ribbon domain-containing protein [Desulfobacterales bacterium]